MFFQTYMRKYVGIWLRVYMKLSFSAKTQKKFQRRNKKTRFERTRCGVPGGTADTGWLENPLRAVT